ncbi:MAG: acyl-CoA dehydrogenase family protein [Phycisphaerales bacterium JB058]
MNFEEPSRLAELRRAVSDFLDDSLPPDVVERVHETGTEHDWGFHRALAKTPWFAGPWPAEAGGSDLGPVEMATVIERLAAAGAPLSGWLTTMNIATTLRGKASPELCDEVIPEVVTGRALIALGLTEPSAGSDVAAISTRAVRDGAEWVIDGQKTFTTLAHESRWVLLLTRTDRDSVLHKGLTVFLVPMDSPGLSLQPVDTLGGERTNLTFYSGVRVADRWRIGSEGGGWSVVMTALAHERGGGFGGNSLFIARLVRVLEQAIAWSREPYGAARPIESPAVAATLGKIATQLEVARLLSTRSSAIAASGSAPVVEAAEAKLQASETLHPAATNLLDLLGPRGLLQRGAANAPAGGWIEHEYRDSPVATIYGGTSEIMRDIIAVRGLGLPKTVGGRR